MAELIDMLFGFWARVGSRNHALDGDADPPMERGNFWGKGANCTVQGCSAVSPAKTAEPIQMPFRLWIRVGPQNHVLYGVQIPHGKGNFGGKRSSPL